jgi:drug/metabolite transporter (DMT)-like permease
MRRKWMPVGGLLLLSLLWATGWIRADLSPGSGAGFRLSPLCREAVLLAVFAVGSGVAEIALRRRWLGWQAIGRAVLVGVGLFVLPAVVTGLVAGTIEDSTRVAVFSLTPLFAVVFEPHVGQGAEQTPENRGGFLAAMTAVAGTFLVFPVELPRSYSSGFALMGLVMAAAAVAAANCIAVREVSHRGSSLLIFAAVVAGSAACLIAAIGAMFRQSAEAGVAMDVWAVLDLIALGLLFWLMRRISAVQMTTRFLIAPLIANLISLALLRPHVEIQSWIGLSLIAAGSGWMIFVRTETVSPSVKFFHFE